MLLYSSLEPKETDLSENGPEDSMCQNNMDFLQSLTFASISGEEITWNTLHSKALSFVSESHDASRELIASILVELSTSFESCLNAK